MTVLANASSNLAVNVNAKQFVAMVNRHCVIYFTVALNAGGGKVGKAQSV
jgi:hypothetical protein